MTRRAWVVLVAAAAWAAPVSAELPTPEEAQRRWLHRLDDRHFTATLRLTVDESAQRMVIRRKEAGGIERALIRMEKPFRVSGLSWLLREEPGGGRTYHRYSARDIPPRPRELPSLRVRDPLQDADPHLLGLRAGAPLPQPESLEAVELDGEPAWLLTERAPDPAIDYDVRRVWLDPTRWIALRVEHERGGEVRLTGRTLEIREIQGVATPVEFRIERPGHPDLRLSFETMDYRREIRDSYFALPDGG